MGVRRGWWMYKFDKYIQSGWKKQWGMERVGLIRSSIVERNLGCLKRQLKRNTKIE